MICFLKRQIVPLVPGHEDMGMTIASAPPSIAQDSFPYSTKQTIELNGLKANDGIKFSALNSNPLDFDFLQGDIASDSTDEEKTINVLWNADNSEAAVNNQASCVISKANNQALTHFAVDLSHNWHWFTSGTIKSIVLQLFACKHATLTNLQLVKANRIVPNLTMRGGKLVNTGVYVFSNNPVLLSIKPLPSTASLQIQISKPNCFFENLSSSKQGALIGKILIQKVSSSAGSTSVAIEPRAFPQKGFYQVRISCLSHEGLQLGELSPAETIEISR